MPKQNFGEAMSAPVGLDKDAANQSLGLISQD